MILTPQQPTLALHARNAAQSAHPELWRGLVGAWVPALGYQGSKMLDASMYHHYAEAFGSPQWGPGYVAYDGTDDRFESSSAAGVYGTTSRSVSAWFRTETTTSGSVMSYGEENGSKEGERWGQTVENGQPWLRVFQGACNWGSSGDYNDGKWHHYVLTAPTGASLSDVKAYLDGVDLGPPTVANAATINTQEVTKLLIGCNIDSGGGNLSRVSFFSGDIASVQLYNRQLNQYQVRTLYNDPLAPFRLRDDTALVTAAMFGGTPSVTIPPPLLNMQMTGSF